MSLTTRVLIGLVAGFLLGLALAGASPSVSAPINAFLAPVGTIFVNLIRMTVIPLVASMLIASAGSLGASGALGRVGARAVGIAVVLLAIAGAISVAVAVPVLARVQIDQAAALALRGPVAGVSSSAPTLAQWFVDLVPQNIVKAGVDGAMLPIILFSVLFGLALARVAEQRRDAVLRAVQGVADAMQRLVAWILELAPVGVFALAVPLASKLGLGAAGAVLVYIVLVVSLTVAVGVLLLYPFGVLAGRMPPSAFVAFCAPAQAVAFASRSSLAALPAMVESAERADMPQVVSGFVLPLAASVFRAGAAVAQTVGVLFLARLYGVTLPPAMLATMYFTAILATFAVPGIPGGSVIAMVPVLAAVNLPIDGIGILLAVDTIPDMFRTTANVTGSMALAAALRRQ
ncbi:MAG: dicarboxylate/amino acid:cation symporter [Acidobacteriia bacterium]|nr:dicarboxylate/amino acid:cation symporter [Terriglobia bacterium]